MPVSFCTLFDSRYLTRGLVMLESIEPYLREDDDVVVLAIDDRAREMLGELNTGSWRVITTPDLHDRELNAVRCTRGHREFCWTCTPALAAWMVRTAPADRIVVYLDADLFFFGAPSILLNELDDGGSILIHEHRFSADRSDFEASSGRFNVGFVAFKANDEGRRCTEHWRAQTIECCVLDPAKGLCGDQGYLTAWPQLYPSLRIMKNLGGGVAPWNVSQYRVSRNSNGPTIDGNPIVFYHFHSFRTLGLRGGSLIAAAQPAYGYEFTSETIKQIYRPYVRQIARATRNVSYRGFSVEADQTPNGKELLRGLLSRNFLFMSRLFT